MCLIFGLSGFTGEEFAYCQDCKNVLQSANEFENLTEKEQIDCLCGQCDTSCADMSSNPNCLSLCSPCEDLRLSDSGFDGFENEMKNLKNQIDAAKRYSQQTTLVDDETCSCTMCLLFAISGFKGEEFASCKDCKNVFKSAKEYKNLTQKEQIDCLCEQCDTSCADMTSNPNCQSMCGPCEDLRLNDSGWDGFENEMKNLEHKLDAAKQQELSKTNLATEKVEPLTGYLLKTRF